MMYLKFKKIALLSFFSLLMLHATISFAYVKGIYLSENTARNSTKMDYLISESKATGINTFVIDVNEKNALYEKNIKKVVDSGIRYVARVTMFPGGATQSEITNKSIWEKRLALANYAISLGAKEIQLDYIRYSSKDGIASSSKATQVYQVISWFRSNLPPTVKLEIDIFGISTFKPAPTIGQDPGMFSSLVNTICPMVYPSHYEPYRYYATRPYETVLESVEALKKQIGVKNVAVYPYIETFNYRYPMTIAQREQYGWAEMRAAKDSGAQGFYVWSASNEYAVLFSILKAHPNVNG